MFCGKCGAKLDKITKLCPICDREKIVELYLKLQRKKRIRKLVGRVCLILILLAVVVTAGLDLFGVIQLPEVIFPQKAVTSWSWNSFASPAERYLRAEILPRYDGQKDALTFPVRGYFNTRSEMSFGSFHEVEYGPIALLSYVKEDYNSDGKDELLTVSIEAVRPQGEVAEAIPLPDNMNRLEMRFALFQFDKKGNVSEKSDAIPLSEAISKTISLSKADNQFLVISSCDRSDLIASNEALYYPVTDAIGPCNHSDSIWKFMVNENAEIVRNWGVSRNIWYDIETKVTTSSRYYAPLSCEDRESVLYYQYEKPGSGFPQNETALYQSEEMACTEINKLLPKLGYPNLEITPFAWDTRWDNTFLPDENGENVLCTISIKATPCKKAAEHETVGEMTLTIEKTNYRK